MDYNIIQILTKKAYLIYGTLKKKKGIRFLKREF